MASITSIPGYNVHKIGKDKYAVSVNNGNMGAFVCNKEQLKQLADVYGVPVKEKKSTAKKVLTGLAIAAGVALAAVGLRKKGINLKSINKENLAKAADNVKDKVVEGAEFVKEKVGSKPQKLGEKVKGLYNKVADFAVKVWNKVKEFVVGVWRKVFPKKEKWVQGELFPVEKPIDKVLKKAKDVKNKGFEFFKGVGQKVKDLFTAPTQVGKRYDKASATAVKNEYLANVAKDVVKAAEKNNSAEWLKAFQKRYPKSAIEVMPR